MSVRFKQACYDRRELACVEDALLGGVDYTARVRTRLEADYGRVLPTGSGSAALDLLFCALDLPRGSEVILPSFTFPSAANTLLRAGLVPVFAEIDPRTLVLDRADALRRVTARTRCVLTTHYGGASVDMDAFRDELGKILLLEDAALSFGAKYRGRPLGAVGEAGILSFHRTKNVSAEEGGALTVGPALAERLGERLARAYDNGTDKAAFLAGKVGGYTWRQAGMNAAMPNLCAAVLDAQLDKADGILAAQRLVWEGYAQALAPLAETCGFALPAVPEYNTDNYHVFYLVFRTNRDRERVRVRLAAAGVDAFFHYLPLHAAEMGQALGWQPEDLPVTMGVSGCLLRLPMHAAMTPEDCPIVAEEIRRALC